MQVVNAVEQQAVAAARQEMWMSLGRVAGAVGLVWVAVLAAVGAGASPLWWALVGFAASVLVDGLREAWSSIRCEREIRRCPTCRSASIRLAEAGRVWDRCSDSGHPDPVGRVPAARQAGEES